MIIQRIMLITIVLVCLQVSGIIAGVHLESDRSVDGFFEVVEKRSFRLTCKSDEPAGVSQEIQWYTSTGELIDSSSISRFTISGSTRHGHAKKTLVFMHILPHDEGQYYCKLFDQGVLVQQVEAAIRVHKGIIWNSNQTVYGGQVGDRLTVDCSVKSEQKVMVEAMDSDDYPLENSPLLKFVRANDEYTIPQLTDDYQDARVRCLAFVKLANNVEVQLERTIQIEVWKKPDFGANEQTVFGIQEQDVTLKCRVQNSVPSVKTMEFLLNGEVLQNDKRRTVNTYVDEQLTEMKIRNLNENDFNTYTCRAHNGKMSSDLKIKLMQAAPPAQPKIGYLGNTNGTTTWQIYGDDNEEPPVIAYSVRYAIRRDGLLAQQPNFKPADDAAREWIRSNQHASSEVVLPKNNDGVYVIRDLRNGESYVFEFSARNAAGSGDPIYINADLKQEYSLPLSGSSSTLTVSFLLVFCLLALRTQLFGL
ncbi:hypothetical protein M3Y95_00510100 [Aphelenchoides besseyi]|nr:hypothetical protein M3Y95_00510100 [Aphelenchoides besseyi]